MGLLDRLLGRSSSRAHDATPEVCQHRDLAPRWEDAEAMGDMDRVSSFICSSCQQSFSLREAERLRSTAGDRFRQQMAD